ncbi:VOC family protein [Georgenia sp. SYP-B2076]|uniref:VOC family protein n=1 Tax=Georgenia sp. SYP-B2076 TaxID=2495881 RepID=UPI001F0BB415|nr:VOC family protein [Georgenia sp. SYP-B2076]
MSDATNTAATSTTQMPGKAEDPAVQVGRLGYVSFTTPDVDRLKEYYTKTLGFALVEESPDLVFLTTGSDHHCVVIEKADVASGRQSIGYEIAGSLSDARRRLSAIGLESELRSDIGPGTPQVLVLDEAETGTPVHLYESQTPSGVGATFDQRPTKLGHVAAYTTSTDNMRAFYQEALGFRWSDTVGDFFVFLRCNSMHHSANFIQSDNFSGMHHIAYEARDMNHLQTMLDTLARDDYSLFWGPGRHTAGHNVFTYHTDPDGHTIELYTQMDVMTNEELGYFDERPWHEQHPMYPQTWEVDLGMLNKWGPSLGEFPR